MEVACHDALLPYEDAMICIWKVKTGELLQSIRFENSPVSVNKAKFLPDGRIVMCLESAYVFKQSFNLVEYGKTDGIQFFSFPRLDSEDEKNERSVALSP
jgi:hypothetical protein